MGDNVPTYKIKDPWHYFVVGVRRGSNQTLENGGWDPPSQQFTLCRHPHHYYIDGRTKADHNYHHFALQDT